MFDDFTTQIQSDEFATEYADYLASLDEEQRWEEEEWRGGEHPRDFLFLEED